jgi:hypothetical protein
MFASSDRMTIILIFDRIVIDRIDSIRLIGFE